MLYCFWFALGLLKVELGIRNLKSTGGQLRIEREKEKHPIFNQISRTFEIQLAGTAS